MRFTNYLPLGTEWLSLGLAERVDVTTPSQADALKVQSGAMNSLSRFNIITSSLGQSPEVPVENYFAARRICQKIFLSGTPLVRETLGISISRKDTDRSGTSISL